MRDLTDILSMFIAPLVIVFAVFFSRRGKTIKRLEEEKEQAKGEANVYKTVLEKKKESDDIKSSVDGLSRDDIKRLLDKDGSLRRTNKDD